MNIPTISPASIQDFELESLMQIGFAYVQLPQPIIEKIQVCLDIAKKFFQGPKEQKEVLKVPEIISPGEKYQGYALRSGSKIAYHVEQFFFEPDSPYGPYAEHTLLINNINTMFTEQIFLVLMQAIFNKLGINPTCCEEATHNPTNSLVFNSYTAIEADRSFIRFNAHKDFGLLTVVFFNEPGLEVFYQDKWQAIPPKENCVVVNVGNALELMTSKRCHSALHRVNNQTDDRLSMIYFYNPSYQKQVKNYIDDTLISPNGELFFKEQFEEYYQATS